MSGIFYDELLRHGPWQEFERNVARLLLHAGWRTPQVVGRSRDGGADVLAVHPKESTVWIFQCKHSTRAGPGKEAIEEVRNAGRLYDADRLCVVSSQPPTRAFRVELERLTARGLPIHHIGPDDLKKSEQSVPDYAPGRFALREYQAEAVERLRGAILETRRGQLVLATGLGKTVVMAELVSDLLSDQLVGQGRVLVLAHTVPLINQLLVSFWRHISKHIRTHRLAEGEKPISYEGVTFATIQSFRNVMSPPFFDLVIVDEAHHLGAPDFLATLERLDPPRLVGVTATPWRADGVSIEHWLGPPVFTMGIKDGLAQGFLSEVDYRVFVDGIDWSFVREQSKYGYTIAQLNKRLLIPTRDDEAIREIRKVFDGDRRRRGLVFSPSQTHARSFAADLRRHGFKAEALTSELDHIARFRTLAQFAAGRLDLLCVVDILNEGIDVPDVDLLVFLRVTHSRRIFIQQLGRGLRTSPDKQDVIVLDFAADIRRVHAAIDLGTTDGEGQVERLPLPHSHVAFRDRSMGKFFYEWIADLGNIQDFDEDEVISLPIIDPEKFDFPTPVD